MRASPCFSSGRLVGRGGRWWSCGRSVGRWCRSVGYQQNPCDLRRHDAGARPFPTLLLSISHIVVDTITRLMVTPPRSWCRRSRLARRPQKVPIRRHRLHGHHCPGASCSHCGDHALLCHCSHSDRALPGRRPCVLRRTTEVTRCDGELTPASDRHRLLSQAARYCTGSERPWLAGSLGRHTRRDHLRARAVTLRLSVPTQSEGDGLTST